MTLNSSVNNIISDNKSLGNLCQHLEECQFVCIDTEFMREGTYCPNLCLIQLADPGGDTFIIDPLTPEIELKPFFGLLKKHFHSKKTFSGNSTKYFLEIKFCTREI